MLIDLRLRGENINFLIFPQTYSIKWYIILLIFMFPVQGVMLHLQSVNLIFLYRSQCLVICQSCIGRLANEKNDIYTVIYGIVTKASKFLYMRRRITVLDVLDMCLKWKSKLHATHVEMFLSCPCRPEMVKVLFMA